MLRARVGRDSLGWVHIASLLYYGASMYALRLSVRFVCFFADSGRAASAIVFEGWDPFRPQLAGFSS